MADIYEVERIVDKKIDKNGQTTYFIKWKDWDESTNTWEPEAHLKNAAKLLAEFNASWKEKDASNSSNSGGLKSANKKSKKTASFRENSDTNKKVTSDIAIRQKCGCKRTSSFRENSDTNKKVTSDIAIPQECGFDKGYVPEKIVGATDAGGTIKFLVKWKDKNDVELITNERARKHCPQLVIKFYEQNIQWDEN